jgi:mxaJ protein
VCSAITPSRTLPARIIDAVVAREVDLAMAWGPLAGYFAQRSETDLEIVPVHPVEDLPRLRFVFDISLAVRRSDRALQQKLEGVLEKNEGRIDRMLAEYGVPRLPITAGDSVSAAWSR